MKKQPIHRFTGNSKAGRRIASATAPLRTNIVPLTREQLEWNAEVETKKAAKQLRKVQS